MVMRRRLNIPLSVLLALGVACGLGGVGGLVASAEDPGRDGLSTVELDAVMAGGDAAAKEGCAVASVPMPRLRHRGGCQDAGGAPAARLPHRR